MALMSARVNGERLRELRAARLMTQDDLAQAAGVSEETISKMETSKGTVRYSTVRKIASALGVPPEELV